MVEERGAQPEAPRMTMFQLLHPTQSSIPGLENENPYVHVRAFEEVIGSFYAQNVTETAKLRFFPFSLKDKAKSWLYTLKPRSIGSWGEMTQEFYKKFFPPHKIQQVKKKISNFAQGNDETLFMAWERFKDTYNFCPTHGYDTWRLVSYFYEGLQPRDRQFVQVACGGEFLQKEPEKAIDYLDEIVENSNTWNGSSLLDSTNRNRSSTTISGGSVFRLKEEDNMNAKINLLTKEIEALKLKGSRGVNVVYIEDPMEACRICQEINHTTSAYKFEEVKFITILRSGKEIGKDAPKANEKSKETPAEKDESGIAKSNDIEKCPFPTPFSQALKLPKNLDVTSEILEHLHQVKVNLPLLHLIKQMPLYAKVIKDLCTVKRKHHVKKIAFLTKQVSVIIQHKVPPKYKDPGCPTISCTVRQYNIERALLDLGASVNLLPFFVYLQLGLGELKPTSITLQLADHSVKKPRGVVEDVLVKVVNFYYPVDFIILDIEPILHPSANISIILDRPFLATANALINCRNGRMKITFGSMIAELNIFNVNPQQFMDEECEYFLPRRVDQEVEKADEKTKFFEKQKTKRKVLQDTRLSKKLLNSSKGVALHVAMMKSARGSNYSFGGSRSGG
uniref:Retrotransposon gag domain-containing protein n=1 Tax=Fagus sylvatica TaxID=28930 RepID=A0A2N9FPM7_FAGSY